MIKKLGKGLDWFENFLIYTGGVLVGLATLSVVLEIFSRTFFGHSFIWVNEMVEYVLLYVPFLGSAWLLREKAHITIDLLESSMSINMRKFSDIMIIFIGLIISGILLWYGSSIILKYFESDLRSLTPIRIPLYYVMLCIPIGSFALLLEFIRKGFFLMKGVSE